MSKIFIGTSGFNYRHWGDDVFYPERVKQADWLEFYSKRFSTVELNITFYRLPSAQTFQSWHRETPKNFRFSIKGSRYITHIKRLKEVETGIKNFFENAEYLSEKLEIVLWQLPPNFKPDLDRLTEFCEILKSNKEAKDVRHAFEFRNDGWFSEEVYGILNKYNFALCMAHSNIWLMKKILTADYLYLRFHGADETYGSKYSDKELKMWAKDIRNWAEAGKDIYAYFNNDAFGYAVENASRLNELLKK